jgi:hypothetical protein
MRRHGDLRVSASPSHRFTVSPRHRVFLGSPLHPISASCYLLSLRAVFLVKRDCPFFVPGDIVINHCFCYSQDEQIEMEKRQRVILYGRSLILGTVGASLQKRPTLEVAYLSIPFPSVQELVDMAPDVILFDAGSARPVAAFALFEICPDLLLIGIDPGNNQARLWSGRELHELSIEDLLHVIERLGDEGAG